MKHTSFPPCAPLSSARMRVPGARSRRMRNTVSSEALSASVTRSVRPLNRTSRGPSYRSRSTRAPASAAATQMSRSSTAFMRACPGAGIGDVLRHALRVDALVLRHLGEGGRLADDRLVRPAEGVRVLLLMDLAHGGVAARLEHSDETPPGILREHGGDGLPHGGRVVREVVDHRDALHFAAQLLSSLDSPEAAKAGRDLVGLQPQRAA